MITKRTVLILGAGASRPYHFPTGAELREFIIGGQMDADLLSRTGFGSDSNALGKWIASSVAIEQEDWAAHERMRNRFRDSQCRSIDLFLAENTEFDAIGRRIIALLLLKWEQEKTLVGDWYAELFNQLISGGRDFPSDRLSVVTFNYDRSLEWFLFRCFVAFIKHQHAEDAWQYVNRVRIVHVYGDLGSLTNTARRSQIPYGGVEQFKAASEQINLVREGERSKYYDRIEAILSDAERVIFVGFGFDAINLDALGIPRKPTGFPAWINQVHNQIFASCRFLSASAREHAISRLGPIRWGDNNAKDFLHGQPLFD